MVKSLLLLSLPLALAPALARADAPTFGQCELTASGTKDAHETMPGGTAAIMTEYWTGAAEQAEVDKLDKATKAAVDSLKLLSFNCQGKDIRLSVIPGNGASKKTIPYGPKTYKLVKGKGDLAVLAHIGSDMMINATGTIAITAFDAKHVAATLDLTGETMKHAPMKLAGKLDFLCPGYSNCKK